MIQLGWDVPPVMPAPQDEPPAWMPEEFAAANDPAEAQDDAEAEDAYFAGEAESQRFVAYDDDEEADFAEAFGDDFPEEDEEETDIAFVEQAIEAASAPQMPRRRGARRRAAGRFPARLRLQRDAGGGLLLLAGDRHGAGRNSRTRAGPGSRRRCAGPRACAAEGDGAGRPAPPGACAASRPGRDRRI